MLKECLGRRPSASWRLRKTQAKMEKREQRSRAQAEGGAQKSRPRVVAEFSNSMGMRPRGPHEEKGARRAERARGEEMAGSGRCGRRHLPPCATATLSCLLNVGWLELCVG